MTANPVLLAVIVNAHGVKGEVKVKNFAESPEILAKAPLSDAKGKTYKLKLRGEAGGLLIAAIDGISDRNAAEALKGVELHTPRSALPNKTIAADLMGLAVETPDGTPLGRVWALLNFGAGDILEVEHANGTALYPFACVKKVDAAKGKVILQPPEEI